MSKPLDQFTLDLISAIAATDRRVNEEGLPYNWWNPHFCLAGHWNEGGSWGNNTDDERYIRSVALSDTSAQFDRHDWPEVRARLIEHYSLPIS